MESSSPTVYDVARRADVSVATVSRVVNNHPSIQDETRLRVRIAIEELGFAPNPSARSMARIRFGKNVLNQEGD